LGGGTGRRCAALALNHLDDQILLVGVEAAQLVLEVEPVEPAKVQKVLTFHVQFAGQDVNTNFVFLQAGLLGKPAVENGVKGG